MRFIYAFIACGLWAEFLTLASDTRVFSDDTALLTLSLVIAGALAGVAISEQQAPTDRKGEADAILERTPGT